MSASLSNSESEHFAIGGDLDSLAVAALYQRTKASCRAGRIPARIDLSKLGQTDSSMLALLLEWQDYAIAHQQTIEFSEPPSSLQVLAGLSQVSELLGWETRSENASAGD